MDKLKSWPVQDAKARFSEFLQACLEQGPQLVTRRGTETAVLVPIEQWRKLEASARPSLKEVLLRKHPIVEDLHIPKRGSFRHRPPPDFSAE